MKGERCFSFLVVIPVYNHYETLLNVLDRTLTQHPHVLVVDDASTDIPSGFPFDRPVEVLRHTENRGKGAAILTAAAWAGEHGFSHIVTLDADGQHFPEDIDLIAAVLKENPRSLAVGCRDFEGPSAENVPGSSRFGRKFSNFWFRVQTGKKVMDAQSGFRGYPLCLLNNLRFRTASYAFEVEVLVRAAWAGLKVVDVPIQVYYQSREQRISHFRGFVDNLRISNLNAWLTMRSMLPWPHAKPCGQEGKKEAVFEWKKPIVSLRRLIQAHNSPRDLAFSAGVGMLLGTLPLVGLHSVSILFLCGYLGLNRYLALGVSQVCAPPFIPAICLEAGYLLRHGSFLTEINMQTLGYQFGDRVLEWALGSVVLAPFLALLPAGIVFFTARAIAVEENEA